MCFSFSVLYLLSVIEASWWKSSDKNCIQQLVALLATKMIFGVIWATKISCGSIWGTILVVNCEASGHPKIQPGSIMGPLISIVGCGKIFLVGSGYWATQRLP